MGGSGVLSVVTCGLILGICQHRIFGASMRLKAKATCEAVEFTLSSLVFILIGLALRGILVRMQQQDSLLVDGLEMAIPTIIATFSILEIQLRPRLLEHLQAYGAAFLNWPLNHVRGDGSD
jgi:NhaP-type Na+/H+ or K+/H+ antiporter